MTPAELLRYERGLSTGVVATGAGISRVTLLKVERGEKVSAQIAKSLADFYEVTVAELLGLEQAA